jgi:hypothetical protein
MSEKTKKPISVLYVPLGQDPQVREIPNDYDALMELVGGSFEGYSITERLTLYVNGNGLLKQLPYNRAGMVGNIAIGKHSSAGISLSLTDKDVGTALEWLLRNDQRPPICHVCGGPGGHTLFCTCRDVLIYCPDCNHQLATVLNGTDKREQFRYGLCGWCRQREARK